MRIPVSLPHARRGIALAAFAAAALAGCSELADERPPTWSYLHAAIIKPSCTTANCHSSLSARAGIDLGDRRDAYLALVGSTCDGPALPGEPPRNFVDPGAPETSTLLYMLRAQDAVRMPPDVALPESEVGLVEQWILEGAPCD